MSSCKTLTDRELLDVWKAGEESAFGEIYERYWQPMLQIAFKILQNKSEAQDVVQEVFIYLWKRKEKVNIECLEAYLKQATRFSVFKILRSKKYDLEFYKRLRLITKNIIEDDPLVYKEQQEILQKLLANLPEDRKRIFLMSREENLTYKQIARKLEISEKTVEKKISQSLKYLRAGISTLFCFFIMIF